MAFKNTERSGSQNSFSQDFGDDFDEPVLSEINVTPFVDVCLVLLLIFMVAAPLMEQGLDVNLPKATINPLKVDQRKIIFYLDHNNQIYYEKTLIPVSQLNQKINQLKGSQSELTIYLKADERLRYQQLARSMALFKKSGVHHIGLITLPE